MSAKSIERIKCQSLALIEIIQNCMSESNVKSITSDEYGFKFGTEDYLITEIGWPTNGKSEKTEIYFSFFPINWQKSVAKFVYYTLGGNEDDFEPLFKKTYKQWLNVA